MQILTWQATSVDERTRSAISMWNQSDLFTLFTQRKLLDLSSSKAKLEGIECAHDFPSWKEIYRLNGFRQKSIITDRRGFIANRNGITRGIHKRKNVSIDIIMSRVLEPEISEWKMKILDGDETDNVTCRVEITSFDAMVKCLKTSSLDVLKIFSFTAIMSP